VTSFNVALCAASTANAAGIGFSASRNKESPVGTQLKSKRRSSRGTFKECCQPSTSWTNLAAAVAEGTEVSEDAHRGPDQ